MDEKIKIILFLNSLSINGISSVVINYCKEVDLDLFEFTIAAGKPIDKQYIKLCKELNISIIELPSKRNHIFRYYKKFSGILDPNKYDIIHIHGNSTTMAIELFIAWLKGIKIRIAHCHNSNCSHPKINKLLKPLFNALYTKGLACSKLAGQWLFGNKPFYVIPNGFEIQKFVFDVDSRNNVRKQLCIEDKFVIGHVGRMNDVKNQKYILDVFKMVASEDEDAFLLLVGNGPSYEEIKDIVNKHPYNERILMYGETEHIENLYAAMDVFVFPSKYEGLGIVMVEAQISGLKCIASYAVPEDAIVSNNVKLIDIKKNDKEKWKNTILSYKKTDYDRSNSFKDNYEKIKRFDINKAAKYVERLYIKFWKNKPR